VTKSAEDAYRDATDRQFAAHELSLGPWTSYSLQRDPRHLAFVLARYKFVAKMLDGRPRVLEIGVGDAFGLPIVAQAVGHVDAIDWDERLLEGNRRRLPHLANVEYHLIDFNRTAPGFTVDAVYWVDVIEHLETSSEPAVLANICRCLSDDGVLLTGTPNVTAAAYASPQSAAGHINLKSFASLRELMQGYFRNVFMFGMNDEVVHSGYGPMSHYLWALAVGPRR
jgi:2-polyprenyl-3-methyl-5-hydroxy-6-metoxy-1,4-benzoquinol methylase